MPFAIALLVILSAACVVSTFVAQGLTYAEYAQMYSPRTAALIVALRLDDAYRSWWFIFLTCALCLNLLLCSVTRAPRVLKKYRAEAEMPGPCDPSDAQAGGVADPSAVFSRLGMKPRKGERDGQAVLFACKDRAGLWGAWICHVGILLLIAGFAFGQTAKREYTVYGVAGQTKQIRGTSLSVTIDDFRVGLREDDTVEQYTTDVTVRDLSEPGGGAQSAGVSVNDPATLHGLRFYQNSMGWAARISVEEDGEPLDSEVVCVGEGLSMADRPELTVFFNAFYPDYAYDSEKGPMTRSGALKDPAYLYSVYYRGDIVGMNVLMPGDVISVPPYTVSFSDPQYYTLLQVKKDPFAPVALAGALVMLAGFFLAFYVQPARAWAVRGEDGTWTVYGSSAKRGRLFADELRRAAGEGG